MYVQPLLPLKLPSTTSVAQKREMLEQSLLYVPKPVDSKRPLLHTPQLYFPQNLPSYPSSMTSAFENEKLFAKMSVDTLFFIFSNQPGTYQQYLAARELKRQSWRFHTQYNTWFQRHRDPSAVTDDYEVGSFVYFDFENGWTQKISHDFKFEYAFMEDVVN